MADDIQNINNDFSPGFLIKDKKGQLKKVQEDQIVDWQIPSEPKQTESPVKQSLPPVLTPQASVTQPKPVSLKPTAPISASGKATFYMDPDDEEEIKKHTEELKKMVDKSDVGKKDNLNSIIDKVISQHDLRFASDVMKKRFSKIVEAHLRDLRDSLETEETLVRSKKIGGVELSAELAGQVVAAVDNEMRQLDFSKEKMPVDQVEKDQQAPVKEDIQQIQEEKQKTSIYAPTPPPFVPRPGDIRKKREETAVPVMPDQQDEGSKELVQEIEKELAALEKKETKQEPEKIEIPAEEPSRPVEPESPSGPLDKRKISIDVESGPIKPLTQEKPSEQALAEEKPSDTSSAQVDTPAHEMYSSPDDRMPKRSVITQPEPSRPQLVDIKQPVKVVGPIDELLDMNIKEFRRSGASPSESADSIFEKVALLEEESWKVKMEGINAWKKSSLIELYVKVGRLSIESGKSIEETINQLKQEGAPYLLKEEFLAINKLNKQLAI